jgi:hypothetical protein
LIKLGEFEKAQQVYDALFDQASNDGEKASYVWINQGEYAEAIKFLSKIN